MTRFSFSSLLSNPLRTAEDQFRIELCLAFPEHAWDRLQAAGGEIPLDI